jgi:hypothetical protein
MLSLKVKQAISEAVQAILQTVSDDELPKGEVNFILHIDGEKDYSWSNIRNTSMRYIQVPDVLIQNLSTKKDGL